MKRKKLRTGIVAIAVLLLLGYALIGGEQNLLSYWKVSRKEVALRQKLAVGETQRRNLTQEIDRLKNDPGYIEKIAREQFNMGKKGEKIFLIKPGAH